MSTETLRANQLRLYFSSLGLCAGRSLAAVGPGGHGVGPSTSRHHPAEAAEIAAQVRVTARRIWVRYSCAYPWQNVFAAAWTALRC